MSKYNQYQKLRAVDEQPQQADEDVELMPTKNSPPLNNQEPPSTNEDKQSTKNSPPLDNQQPSSTDDNQQLTTNINEQKLPATNNIHDFGDKVSDENIHEFGCFDCCCMCIGLLVFLLAGVGIVNLFYPLHREDYFPKFNLNSLSVTGFNQTNRMSGDWDLVFSAANFNNRDEMTFKLSQITVSLMHKNQETSIWVMALPSFDLYPTSVKMYIPGKFSGSSDFLDKSTAKAIADGIKADGKVKFDVKLQSYAHYDSYYGLLTALCNNVEFFVSLDTQRGRMSSGTADCKTLFNYNNL